MIGRWNSQRWGLWADNVVLNSGSGGATLAADDIAGIHHQRVKIEHGADGSATDVSTASPLPVGGAAAHDAAAAGNPLPMGAEFDDTTPDAVDEGDIGRLRISANRNLYVTLRDAAGNERGVNVDASGQIAVTAASLPLPSGASTAAKQDTAQTALDAIKTATELIDDAAHARNGAFSKSLAIGGELDDTTPVAATEGNVSPVRITAQRAVHANLRKNDGTELGTSTDPVRTDPTGTTTQPVSVAAALPAGTNNIGDVGVLTLPNVTLAAGTNTNEVVGDAAHDAAIAGNPVSVGGVSIDMDDTAPPNRVSAEAEAVRIGTDRDGAVFAHPHGPQVWSYHSDGSAALTDASVHAAPGVGLALYVTDIIVGKDAATAMNIFFEEGASKVLGPWYLEAVAGRGLAIHFQTPKKITANTALTVTTSAAIAHSVDVTGFVGAG